MGIALSDENQLLAAESLETLDRKTLGGSTTLEEKISSLAKDYSVAEFLIGLPLNMDGSAGDSAQNVTRFAEKLNRLTGLSVHTWDERLTTAAAQRTQRELDLPLKKRRDKKKLDQIAALILLQNYLDYRSCCSERGEDSEDRK